MKKSSIRSAAAPQRSRSAFTLLELLIVLAIILVIAAMVVPNLVTSQGEAMIKVAKANIKSLEDVAKRYAVDHDASYYIGSGQDAWNEFMAPQPYRDRQLKPYFEDIPLDPWGNLYGYEWDGTGHSKVSNAAKPAIWSFGPNKQDDGGSGDDINNWTTSAAQ
ncbi:MAG: type II secretion system protein GspG [Planctomycetaceae bacterium]|nr:type II secretion system protein GspG [Planctomycetaceae bacterium]